MRKNGIGFAAQMIKKFKHRGLKKFFERGDKSQLPQAHVGRIERMLDNLDVAEKPKDMGFPGYSLHPLKGEFAGFWSISVTGNWRIVFKFEESDVTQVDLVDYH